MGCIKQHLRNVRQALLALLALALLPAVLEAAGLGFQNKTNYPVYVQGSTVVNGQLRRGPLLYIKPGETAWDVNLANGKRTVEVFNTSNHSLCKATVNFQGTDQFFVVQPLAVLAGQPPQAKLDGPYSPPKKNPGAAAK